MKHKRGLVLFLGVVLTLSACSVKNRTDLMTAPSFPPQTAWRGQENILGWRLAGKAENDLFLALQARGEETASLENAAVEKDALAKPLSESARPETEAEKTSEQKATASSSLSTPHPSAAHSLTGTTVSAQRPAENANKGTALPPLATLTPSSSPCPSPTPSVPDVAASELPAQTEPDAEPTKAPHAQTHGEERYMAQEKTGLCKADIANAVKLCEYMYREYIQAAWGGGEFDNAYYFHYDALGEFTSRMIQETYKHFPGAYQEPVFTDKAIARLINVDQGIKVILNARFDESGDRSYPMRFIVHNVEGRLYIGDWNIPSRNAYSDFFRPGEYNVFDIALWESPIYVVDLEIKLAAASRNADSAKYFLMDP